MPMLRQHPIYVLASFWYLTFAERYRPPGCLDNIVTPLPHSIRQARRVKHALEYSR